MNRAKLVIALVVVAAAIGCADVSAPLPLALLNGTWGIGPPANNPLGTSIYFGARVAGTDISGDGIWHEASGPSGQLTISGVGAGDSIYFDLTYTNPAIPGRITRHRSFVGQLVSIDALVGITTEDGFGSQQQTFRRVPPDSTL